MDFTVRKRCIGLLFEDLDMKLMNDLTLLEEAPL